MEVNNQNHFIKLLAEAIERDEDLINFEDDFRKYEEWDSLGLLSVMVMLEEEYSTNINRDDLDNCITISDLFQFVNHVQK